MLELIVTLFVALIVVAIYCRSGNLFSLPFYWAAVFVCIYAGLLILRAEIGGSSYLYAALGFGMFFLGLLTVDTFYFFLKRHDTRKARSRQPHSNNQSIRPSLRPVQQPKRTRIGLLFPLLPLNIGLFVSLLGATFITAIFFANQGIPILSSFPALAWIQATSGIINRLMTVFGPGCFASLGLIAWAVHRETGSLAAKVLMYVGLGLAIFAQSLLASKAAAIMIFIWFNIVLFYLNKKREMRKSVLPFLIVVIPMSAAIVAVRSMSTSGYLQSGTISHTFASRVTTVAAEPLDFIFKYADRFGATRGEGIHRELARMEDQLTGGHKTPLLTEYVFDLLNGMPTYKTGLSSAITLEGTGYIEWGLEGLILYSFIQGLFFGWLHRYLLHQEKISLISVVFWASIMGYAMNASVSGNILIPLESSFLTAIPPVVFILLFGAFFLVPMARRYESHGGRKVSRVPQTQAKVEPGVKSTSAIFRV